MTNDTTSLLGLDGVEVFAVEMDEHDNPLLALVTAADAVRYCPECGQVSQHPRSWVRTRPQGNAADRPQVEGHTPAPKLPGGAPLRRTARSTARVPVRVLRPTRPLNARLEAARQVGLRRGR